MSSIYTSAEPLIALLGDDDKEIRQEALALILSHVHEFWSQLASHVKTIEVMSTGDDQMAKTAALVAAKIHYHIGDQTKALHYALQSEYLTAQLLSGGSIGDNNNIDKIDSLVDIVDPQVQILDEQFQQAMIARAIDLYITSQRSSYLAAVAAATAADVINGDIDLLPPPPPQQQRSQSQQETISPQIPILLKLMIDRSINFGEFTCALGLAIDTLRLDWLHHILITVSAKNAAMLMKETFKIAVEIVDIHPFRQELLKTLTDLYLTAPTPSAQAAGGLTPIQTPTPSESGVGIIVEGGSGGDNILDDNQDETLRPSHDTPLSVVSDILALCQCLQALDDAEQTADVLIKLVSSPNHSDHLLAYQVAYDLTQTQQIAFTQHVATFIGQGSTTSTATSTTASSSTAAAPTPAAIRTAKITPVATSGSAAAASSSTAATPASRGLGGLGGGLYGGLGGGLPPAGRSALSTNNTATPNLPTVEPSDLESNDLNNNNNNNTQQEQQSQEQPQQDEQQLETAKTNLCNILTGISATLLHNHFLYKHHTQPIDEWFSLLTNFYDFGNDNTIASQLYSGYAIANAGTNRDGCIRGSWSTFDKLTEWSDFTARAALGNIYRGQYDAIKVILQPFLPNPRQMSTVENVDVEGGNYTHGGSLYAMGLAACGIANNHTNYLTQVLEKATVTKDQPVQAGASLAIGLCSFGSGDLELFSLLRPISWSSQPIAGLCAGVSTGLIYCGLSHLPEVQDIVNETLPIARSNDHPSIQFGLGLGLALIYFNAQQGAETILAQLRSPPLSTQYTRWLSCWIDAMAYCGTGNIKVVNRLLDLAIIDPDNDVKRTAIMSLAFVLLNEPMQCISILEPLATSYNEHIRYAVAMSIGLVTSSSSIGNTVGALQSDYSTVVLQALAILQPLLKDKNDVVRQGAIIGYSLALQQTTSQPKYQEAVTMIEECFTAKRTHAATRVSVVHRVGAALGAGILHASGMNSNVRLVSPLGNQKRTIAIAGMMLFCNYWTWFPLVNMFALALSPTAVIGTYFAPGPAATTTTATAQPATISAQQAAQQQTSLPISNIRIAPNLKFVVKMSKLALQYPKKEVDEAKSTLKKVIVNTLSTSKKSKQQHGGDGKVDGGNTSANQSSSKNNLTNNNNNNHNNNSSSLGRTPSLRSFGSELTRSFSKTSNKNDTTTMNDDDGDDKAKKAADKLSAFNNVNLVRGAPLGSTTTTTTAATTTKDGGERRGSASSLDKPTLSLSASQISLNAERKRRNREDKVPISVISNCSRVLPRHISKVFCPTGQQYQPIKKRNFGIMVVKKMFDLPPQQQELPSTTTAETMTESDNKDGEDKKDPLAMLTTGAGGGNGNGESVDNNNDNNNNNNNKKADQLSSPPQITPGGDIAQSEPSVPGPFTMNDDDDE